MIVTPITSVRGDGGNLGLSIGREYEVLGIEADDYRLLIDEEDPHWPNEPLLFEHFCFRVVDSHEPEFWMCERGDEGERYCYPSEWFHGCFVEKYHDEMADVVDQFHRDLRRYYPRTWHERFGRPKRLVCDSKK